MSNIPATMSEDSPPNHGEGKPHETDPSHSETSNPNYSNSSHGIKSLANFYQGVAEYGQKSHTTSGAVPWLPEDNVTLRYIEDTIEIELHDNDSTLQGKIKSPADIENVLQARWKDLSQHFERSIERPTTNTDKEKFATYYTTSELDVKFSFLDYRRAGWTEVAKALGPGTKVNNAIWTKLSTQSRPIMSTVAESSSHSVYTTVRPTSLHAVAKIDDDFFVLALSNHAKFDHNRYVNGWDKNAHQPAHVPLPEAIMKAQALDNSEILFQQLMQHFNDDAQEVAKLSWIWRTEIANSITKWAMIKAHKGIGKSCSC
jgi:hypothetical protein